MSISEQISKANEQLLTTGGHTLAESATYIDGEGVEYSCMVKIDRGESREDSEMQTMLSEADEFEGTAMIQKTAALAAAFGCPERGHRLETALEKWAFRELVADLPGAWIVKVGRKVLRKEEF